MHDLHQAAEIRKLKSERSTYDQAWDCYRTQVSHPYLDSTLLELLSQPTLITRKRVSSLVVGFTRD